VGGGLGLKTAWAEFASILAPLYVILLRYGFHEARGSQFNVSPPHLIDPVSVLRAKTKVPSSAVEPSGPAAISKS
jgi:hypothetical protein